MKKLNKEEQTLIDLLTDKLIEVAHNPNLRKDFIISYAQTKEDGKNVTTSLRFYKDEDLMSEIEHQALFYINIEDSERAAYWLEQMKDEPTQWKHTSTYFSYCASERADNEDYESAIKLYEEYLSAAINSPEGIPCSILGKYAECLVKSGNIEGLLSLATKVFVIGLHYLDITHDNVMQELSQNYSREEVELIQTMLQLVKECADNEDDAQTKFMIDYYFAYEQAYFYACTGRITQAKNEFSRFCDLVELDADDEVRNMYEFANLNGEERSNRYEWFKHLSHTLLPTLYEKGSTLPVELAFGFAAPPKRPRPRKGSFDWLYAQAEKSYLAKLHNKAIEQDYENMHSLASAYRHGTGVPMNLRLADCWDELANH